MTSVDDDFFAHGGGSLTAAQLVSAIRERFPTTTVADVYDHPRIGALAAALDDAGPTAAARRPVRPVPPTTGLLLTLLGLPVQVLRGLRVLTWTALVAAVLARDDPARPAVLPWWALVVALLLFVTPIGKMAVTVVLARLLLAGVRPGDHPRGGSVHVRVWLAERIAEAVDGPSTAERRGSATTRGRLVPGSAATSTCTPCRRSPACSPSASARRSSPRSTSSGTGSTATVPARPRPGRRGRRRAQPLDAPARSARRRGRGGRGRLRRHRQGARRGALGRFPRGTRGVGASRPGGASPGPSSLARRVRGRVGRRGRPARRGRRAGLAVAVVLVGPAGTLGTAVLRGLAAVPLATLVAGWSTRSWWSRGPAARPRPARGPAPVRPVASGLAGVVHRARARRGAHAPVPALRPRW